MLNSSIFDASWYVSDAGIMVQTIFQMSLKSFFLYRTGTGIQLIPLLNYFVVINLLVFTCPLVLHGHSVGRSENIRFPSSSQLELDQQLV
jgi:hypothetical protein